MVEVIVLELNEINLEFVQAYTALGKLPNLKVLVEAHGYCETTSELRYEEWEPWIQWVSAHSGQTLAQHGVFRLGDIVETEVEQIWEQLERKGLRVGAFSPMNANNRTSSPAFFLPDPWTDTVISAPAAVKRVYAAIRKAVNGNASGQFTLGILADLALGLARFARPANYPHYLALAIMSVRRSWSRAVFLDVFLGDLFIHLMKRSRPQFATVFLNAAAHIQHHYMFGSRVYSGPASNPSWYLAADDDPILAVYAVYDRLIGQLRRTFPKARLMIATGLHQVPHAKETYYWRLVDHAAFLERIGASFTAVMPRMSRDFLMSFADELEAERTEELLLSARTDDDAPLFTVDNRGRDLFVEMIYSREIADGTGWMVGNRHFEDLRSQVAFVAIKNGEHDGIGYFIDTGLQAKQQVERFPLTELPARIEAALNLTLPAKPVLRARQRQLESAP